MKATCPGCGCIGSIEAFLADAEARECVAIAAAMPADLGPLALRYMTLFRPPKRTLSWDRARRILQELATMIAARQVSRNRREYPASPELFANAMTQMLDQRERLALPLKSHGYLITIVVGESPKAAGAAEAAEESLKQLASQQRSGSRSAAAAELAGEIALRKRLRMPEMTDAEKADFMRSKGVEP